jgi:hypothetical protein
MMLGCGIRELLPKEVCEFLTYWLAWMFEISRPLNSLEEVVLVYWACAAIWFYSVTKLLTAPLFLEFLVEADPLTLAAAKKLVVLLRRDRERGWPS